MPTDRYESQSRIGEQHPSGCGDRGAGFGVPATTESGGDTKVGASGSIGPGFGVVATLLAAVDAAIVAYNRG